MTEQNSPPATASSKPDTPKGARAVCSIAVDAITVPSERLRKLRPEVVDWLVESITARSLLEPIIVRRRGVGYELIAGHHRFEAARNCGHQTIRAEVYDSLSDDEAELIQIDENLIRANLSDAERILHVARRKELYEKLHPETKHGGAIIGSYSKPLPLRFDGCVMPSCPSIAVRCGSAPQWICGEQ